MSNSLSVDAQRTADSAAHLDDIAGKLEQAVAANRDALTVPAAGSDEVSVAAAKTFNEVADSFEDQVLKGVAAIRDVADVIRTQTHAIVGRDDQVAAEIAGS
ncbi:hypothetical protein GCM10027169_07230 [Gordonia jinhuaensis]|uniref:PE domain-containing protein n=1 Tax=Gordonia jinhuaensis TaxID=1517702 RepID=A0A916WP76_9ACTN|nr:PE domain-containing protein [Gordonia jinhuaensis]GGB21307.1 hypothetical protein GCM10011489_06830 [Gordonia jinhuaensis]